MHPIFDFQRSRQIQCHPHPPKQCNTPPLSLAFSSPSAPSVSLRPPLPLLTPPYFTSPGPFLSALSPSAPSFSLSLPAPRSFLSPLFASPGTHSSRFSLIPLLSARCLFPLSFTTSPQTCSVLFSALPTLSFRPALFSFLYFFPFAPYSAAAHLAFHRASLLTFF